MKVVADVEFDGLHPTKCWVVVCKDVDTKQRHTFKGKDLEDGTFRRFSSGVSLWIGANFLCFDRVHLERLGVVSIPVNRVVDLQIISRTVHFQRRIYPGCKAGAHSVENFALEFKQFKPPIDVYDDPNRIDEYVHRCEEDVEITFNMWRKFEKYITDKSWAKAFRVEHELALICQEMTDNGFFFNVKNTRKYHKTIEKDLEKLSQEIVADVGDVLDKHLEHTVRFTLSGRPFATTTKFADRHGIDLSSKKDGDVVKVPTYRPFNPASAPDRVRYLNRCGWRPYVKTKGHREADRELKWATRDQDWDRASDLRAKLERYSELGWECSEDNLETLPADAPEAARKLVEWLTLNARYKRLEEWLAHVDASDERMHGRFWHIGSWTHRMSHFNPNCGNIFANFHSNKSVEEMSPVERIKNQWDNHLRALWEVTPGWIMIGTDAEGIQLRILAHLMQDPDYIDAVAHGNKDLGTDVHNVNLRALGLNHLVRDDAKTFILSLG